MPKRVIRHAVTQPSDSSIRLIPLTHGMNAIIDEKDYDRVSAHNWYAWKSRQTYYAITYIVSAGKRFSVPMHRFILGLSFFSKFCVDHANKNGLDNRTCNIRVATHSQNMKNRRLGKNNTSGFKGVWWSAGRKKWIAQIKSDCKKTQIGAFDSPKEAAAAYNAAALSLHGDFASLNDLGQSSPFEPRAEQLNLLK